MASIHKSITNKKEGDLMEAKKTPKRTKPIQSKKDDSITIKKNIPPFNYEDEEEISFEEGLQRIMETTTKLRESVVGDIMKDYHTKIVEPLIDGLLNGMTDFTKNLGILSSSMIQAMTQPLVEEAKKLHEQWIQKLATLESEEEIREAIRQSIYEIKNPYQKQDDELKEFSETYKDDDFLPEEKEEQRRLFREGLKELEEEYFQEVMIAKAKLQGLSTEEEEDLKQQIRNVVEPVNTAFLTGKNVAKLFSQKEAIGEDNQGNPIAINLSNDKLKKVKTYDDEGNVSIIQEADFFIQYIFENGLDSGEWSGKERLVFQNVIYFNFIYDEINRIKNTANQQISTLIKEIPTIIPKDTIARMTRGIDNPKQRLQKVDIDSVDQIMQKFKTKRTYINYDKLREKYKEKFGEEIELDRFKTIGEGEFPSFIDSELHTGINLKEEFSKFGIPFEREIEKFDGYIIKKIPIFDTLKMTNEVEFLPFKMNNYLQQNDSGLAINFEAQSLISRLKSYIRPPHNKPADFGPLHKFPIDEKGKPIPNWKEKLKDESFKKNHIASWRYSIEEKVDTFFQHCYDSISKKEEAELFGHYEENLFFASGTEKQSTAKDRQRRTKLLNKIEAYLTKAKEDFIILDFELIGRNFQNKEIVVNRGTKNKKKNTIPIEKIKIISIKDKELNNMKRTSESAKSKTR